MVLGAESSGTDVEMWKLGRGYMMRWVLYMVGEVEIVIS